MASEKSKQPVLHELGQAHVLVNRSLTDFHQIALKRYNLNAIEWLLLGTIADASKDGGIRVTDLAAAFNVKSTYITAMLNDLRAKDYIETRFDASDARVRLAIITTKGAKEVTVVERYMQKEITRLLGDILSADELEKYSRVIKKLSRVLP